MSKKLKRLFSTLLVIDSSEIRGKKKRLHLLYEAREKVLLDFEIGNNKEVEHAEIILEDIEGSILLADRGYWQWEFIEKMKEKMKLYVRPRGRKGKEFMEREINRLIYSKRWEIEWYIERLKQRIKMRGMNERTLKAQITYMLLGQQLTMLIDALSAHPKMIRLIEK
ncbi:transposase [Thermosipho globiformans]|uniref:transposase n=1 Tax=Thermosipho globiformans TaxID=380685 RepID=UPI001F4990C2|nr:transposase [Thermosipho globiformans]